MAKGLVHPERVLWADVAITRGELFDHYAAVAGRFLPHVRGRPLTVVRCPDGVGPSCVYLRHDQAWAPRPIRVVRIRERAKVGEYFVIDDLASVLALVLMDIVEIHTWNTRDDDVERPDRLVFDLDPGPDVAWSRVVAAAHRVRAVLDALGLESWVKTTGGDGLHVVAPIVAEVDWRAALTFCKAVAKLLVADDRRTFTTRVAKEGREDRILVDVLRNNRTNTSVAAWSPRARPGAPVSMPIAWDELDAGLDPRAFTLRTARARAEGADPWAGYFRSRQRLRPDVVAALGGQTASIRTDGNR